MKEFTHELRQFQHLNTLAPNGCSVFFGSTFFSHTPVAELAHAAGVEQTVCNRCLPGLTAEKAQKLFADILQGLTPNQIFLCFGEEELQQEDFSADRFMEQYEWLLYTIHRTTGAKLHIVSAVSSSPMAAAVNRKLHNLAKSTGCNYIDISDALQKQNPQTEVFHRLRPFFRNHITFADAMNFSA